jgi:hypothetical protein
MFEKNRNNIDGILFTILMFFVSLVFLSCFELLLYGFFFIELSFIVNHDLDNFFSDSTHCNLKLTILFKKIHFNFLDCFHLNLMNRYWRLIFIDYHDLFIH